MWVVDAMPCDMLSHKGQQATALSLLAAASQTIAGRVCAAASLLSISSCIAVLTGPTFIHLYHRCPPKIDDCFEYVPYKNYVKVMRWGICHPTCCNLWK